jgi:ribosomal protein S18 acetylase RimI-like enzyme
MRASEKNLYDFYDTVGTLQGVTCTQKDRFSVILEDSSAWPRIVYNLAGGNDLPYVFRDAPGFSGNPSEYPFAVINRELVTPDVADLMRTIPAYPVELWELMEISVSRLTSSFLMEGAVIERIFSGRDLDAFSGVVNQCLMGNTPINADLVNAMAETAGFDFYCLRFNGEMVSTMLSFSCNGVSGLYLVATLPEYRGRGFAGNLIRFVLNFLFNQGKEKVVLQADRKAVPLYLKTGFISVGQLAIIRKF